MRYAFFNISIAFFFIFDFFYLWTSSAQFELAFAFQPYSRGPKESWLTCTIAAPQNTLHEIVVRAVLNLMNDCRNLTAVLVQLSQ